MDKFQDCHPLGMPLIIAILLPWVYSLPSGMSETHPVTSLACLVSWILPVDTIHTDGKKMAP